METPPNTTESTTITESAIGNVSGHPRGSAAAAFAGERSPERASVFAVVGISPRVMSRFGAGSYGRRRNLGQPPRPPRLIRRIAHPPSANTSGLGYLAPLIVALDKVGSLARNPFNGLRLPHRSPVAPSMRARPGLVRCGSPRPITRAMAAPIRSAAASISLSAIWA